jgi:hypothetical protein
VRQRYADLLLDESDNPALARLVRDLDGVANHPAPDYLQARIGAELMTAIERQKAEGRIQTVAAKVTSRGSTRWPTLL